MVDDDPGVIKVVKASLQLEGFRVTGVADGFRAVDLVRDEPPVLVILDVMMPGMGGFEVCQQIRGFSDVPIVMLTAAGGENDIVRGLNLGADDYVAKPFSCGELAARVKAVLRRATGPAEEGPPAFRVGGLVVDASQGLVTMAGQEVCLPRTECRLLCVLARHAGRVMTYEHILTEVWGDEYTRFDIRVLEAAVSRLRGRLAQGCGAHDYIVSQKGIGYFFNPPPEPAEPGLGWPAPRQARGET